jgi:outer membrane lipoprotein SlyB
MKINTTLSTLTLAALFTAPLSGFAQYESTHQRAVASQRRHDHRHHTGAKIVGGSAAGGAVIGALAGGGKGALIGGAIGAGGGAIANKVRVDNGVKAREQRERGYPPPR